ncbi:MAG TPA: hypothetical protein PK788_03535 [Gemmatimonadaceae bacterium]|nr:hypothetical protein [Gemmatimonadaceae bacterium]HRQ78133.1 hypothetical protein [Gemmatimonadaceae bacterium]
MNLQSSLTLYKSLRDWRPMFGGVLLAMLLAVLVGRRSIDFLSQVVFYGYPLLAIKSIADGFAFAQRAPVWAMLAQRGEPDTKAMWSLLGGGMAIYVGFALLLGVGVVVGGILPPAQEGLFSFWSRALLWMVVCGLAVAATATLSRRSTAGLAILWLALPFVNRVAQSSLEYSDRLRMAIDFLLPPVMSLNAFADMLAGNEVASAGTIIAHILFFPLLCATIIHVRIRALANPELPRIE